MVPAVKPVWAIVIIAGVCLGPEAGFLCGALTMFASNIFFGINGPWTPWQMFGLGVNRFLAEFFFQKADCQKKHAKYLCILDSFAL